MPKFSYTVLNKENKQLAGTINAPDENSARRELNDLGFSVLQMDMLKEEISAKEHGASALKFQFTSYDKTGKKIIGTIQAPERLEAYKRLISEYVFTVESLIDQSLSETEKNQQMLRGVHDLEDQLKEEDFAKKVKVDQNLVDQKLFAEKQEKLHTQVNFVLKKVHEIIETFQNDLHPATKEKIKYYVEKILRIKNSTNLDYIRETCEELLNYLQKEELFLFEEQKQKEKTQLAVEAKSMMFQLQNSNKKPSISLTEQLENWRREHIINNNSPSFIERSINILISVFIGAPLETPEILELKAKIKNVQSQLKQFINLYFQAPNPEFKAETRTTLKRLWYERKKLKTELHTIIKKAHQDRMVHVDLTNTEKVETELFKFSGFVLFFYIIYYFVSIYINSKQIDIFDLQYFNIIFYSDFLKNFFVLLFLFHSLLGLKIYFFHRNPLGEFILIPCFIILSLMIILNF